MLAKAPLNFPECLQLSGKSSQNPRLFDPFCPISIGYGHGRSYLNRRKTIWPKMRVLVRAGYSRKQMETPGAYQLINDETGEKVIVWGDIDDDSPIPSNEVLSWNPMGRAGSNGKEYKKKTTKKTDGTGGGVQPATAVSNNRDSTTRIGGLARSFGRLKAQRVRALIKKSSETKHENAEDDSGAVLEETHFNEAVSSESSDSEVEYEAIKSNVSALGHRGSISKALQPQEINDALQGKQKVSVSRASTASKRGWGNGEPTRSYRSDYHPADLIKQRPKSLNNDGFFSRKSFRDLGCSDEMIESLRGLLFVRPSNIQAMAFVPVFEGKSCIIADQSGSGKTLAYLTPIVQRLKQEELQGLVKSSPSSPKVIVLVPTAELGSQVLSNCRSMSKYGVPFRSMVATGGFRQKTQLENLKQNLDVLIATPGRFIFLLQEGFLQLSNLKCVVLDEVDILYSDEDFEQALKSLISCAPITTQYLFVTATLPVDIYNKLVEVFPDCEVIMGPGMHRTSSGLEEILVDCSGDDRAEKSPETAFLNKKAALLQLVEESPVSKTIVFCNKIETCRKVENALKRFDRKEHHIRVLPFHAALDQELRVANMKDFLNSKSKEESLFLVCTDRASRGIDFTGVDHVVLFDYPRDPSEYVRRVGRTARGAGGTGKAFVFVVGKQVFLARRIIERNKKGHPLHDVPAAYERFG